MKRSSTTTLKTFGIASAQPPATRRPRRPPGGSAGPGGSRKGERRGEALEAALVQVHASYMRQGLALLHKRNATTSVIGEGKLRFTGSGLSDFEGTVAPGLSVRLEAKSCRPSRRLASGEYAAPRWKLSSLTDKQRGRFRKEAPFGALCLLVIGVEWPIGQLQIFAVPWSEYEAWALLADQGQAAASWSLEDLSVVGIRCRGVDWLSAVKSAPDRFSLPAAWRVASSA